MALPKTPGLKSEVFFDMEMTEIRTKQEGDSIFGYNKPKSKLSHRYLNSYRTLQREKLIPNKSLK